VSLSAKVAIVAEQLHRVPAGGIGVYIRSLLRGLADVGPAEGFEAPVVVTSRGLNHSQRASLPPNTELRTLFAPLNVNVELAHRGLPLPGSGRVLRGVDLVHATSLDLVRCEQPTTAFVHDVLWRDWPAAYTPRGIAWHERALEQTLSRARIVMVPSQVVAASLVRAGADPERVRVVAEGSDHLPMVARRPRRRDSSPFFLSVATVQPRKNLLGLLEAYRRYRSRHSDNAVGLKLVGPSGWGPDLPELPSGVELVGSVTDVALAELYAEARALVFVPLAEGFGLPVVEAWRAGTPVIASTGVPIAAEHPDAVRMVNDPTDPESLATALAEVAEGHGSVQEDRAVSIGLSRAAALTWRSTAQQHMDLWSTVRSDR
jgi:glycosyltransferase involved in cell wall biosynthesis